MSSGVRDLEGCGLHGRLHKLCDYGLCMHSRCPEQLHACKGLHPDVKMESLGHDEDFHREFIMAHFFMYSTGMIKAPFIVYTC